MSTAADFMATALAEAGIKRVYGVVGDSLNGFSDAAPPPWYHRLDSHAT